MRCLVIGDPIIDTHTDIKYAHTSEEGTAQHNVYDVVSPSQVMMGGAGNVANIIGRAEIKTDFFYGCYIPHHFEDSFCSLVTARPFFGEKPWVPEKTRLWNGGHIVARLDKEEPPVPWDLSQGWPLKPTHDIYDVVVIIDYGKTFMNREVVQRIVDSFPSAKWILMDPKDPYFVDLRGIDIYTPSSAEVWRTGRTAVTLSREKPRSRIVETQGSRGFSCFWNGDLFVHADSVADKVVDTCGAGEHFIATLAVALLKKEPLRRALDMANLAAGASVAFRGCTTSYISI